MCERLLYLQEMYISGQNVCIVFYGNSIGTFTPGNIAITNQTLSNQASRYIFKCIKIAYYGTRHASVQFTSGFDVSLYICLVRCVDKLASA